MPMDEDVGLLSRQGNRDDMIIPRGLEITAGTTADAFTLGGCHETWTQWKCKSNENANGGNNT